MFNYVKIECKELPTIYPRVGYTDIVDYKYISDRVVSRGYYFEKFLTDKKFNIRNDSIYQQRTIQTILYNKYELKIFATESIGVQLLELAKYMVVTLQDGSIHNAVITAITEESNINETRLSVYTVEYYDINLNNYPEAVQPINNFLESRYLRSKFFIPVGDSDLIVAQNYLNGIRFSSTKTIDTYFTSLSDKGTIFTELTPFIDISEPKQAITELNGLEITTQVSNKNIAQTRFYLNESDKNLVTKYLPMCDNVTLYYKKNGISYTLLALETTIAEVVEIVGAVDLYRIDINIVYSNLVFNKLA